MVVCFFIFTPTYYIRVLIAIYTNNLLHKIITGSTYVQ